MADKKERTKKTKKAVDVKVEENKVEILPALDELVEEAVRWINNIFKSNIINTYIEIGNYILEQFFDNDPKKAQSFNPHKESSFKRLSERQDLLISRNSLYRAVQVAIQEKHLATLSEMNRLNYTHRLALLPLKDIEKKQELVVLAVEEKLTSSELGKKVKEARKGEKSGVGRKPIPEIKKNVSKIYKITEQEGFLNGWDQEQLSKLKEDDLDKLRESTQSIIATMSRLDEALKNLFPRQEEE